MSDLVKQPKPESLTSLLKLMDENLFTPVMLAHALMLLEHEAGHIVPDVQSEEGRKNINKLSRAIGGAIKRLDERRASYVADLKSRPAAIDKLFREEFREPAEQFKSAVRKPLDDWAEEQRQADEETDRLLGIVNAPIELGTSAVELEKRLDDLCSLDLPDWVSETQRDALAASIAASVPRVTAALGAARAAEAQTAELARLRSVEREAELMRAREEAAAVARAEATAAADQRARDTAARAADELRRQELARQDAERRAAEAEATSRARAEAALEAERSRVAAEKATEQLQALARASDRDHRARINREVLADLCGLPEVVLSESQARAIIAAIARGLVSHVSITY